MKRTSLRRTSMPQRKTRLRSRNGSMFPKRRHRAYMRWLKANPEPCEVCGWHQASRSHLDAKGNGGGDLYNVAWLCQNRARVDGAGRWISVKGCHEKQEKRTDAFIAECGIDIREMARARTERFLAEQEAA